MNVVIVPPCQEPCCRVKRGETPRPETPEEVGRRIAKVILDGIARPVPWQTRLADVKALNRRRRAPTLSSETVPDEGVGS